MKRTPLINDQKPRVPGSAGITYLDSAPEPAQGMIGDIVVDVSTGACFIKNLTGWTSTMSENLRDAIEASTLLVEHKTEKGNVRTAQIARAHFLIHTKMMAGKINACYRHGTGLRAGWSR